MSNPLDYNGGMKGALYALFEWGLVAEPALAKKERRVARELQQPSVAQKSRVRDPATLRSARDTLQEWLMILAKERALCRRKRSFSKAGACARPLRRPEVGQCPGQSGTNPAESRIIQQKTGFTIFYFFGEGVPPGGAACGLVFAYGHHRNFSPQIYRGARVLQLSSERLHDVRFCRFWNSKAAVRIEGLVLSDMGRGRVAADETSVPTHRQKFSSMRLRKLCASVKNSRSPLINTRGGVNTGKKAWNKEKKQRRTDGERPILWPRHPRLFMRRLLKTGCQVTACPAAPFEVIFNHG
ncbi:MAG: hypothetical protein JWR26_4056 [Pedosphaera sp.]|nr:hypothetical protein [Pedosphaera sp.]